MKIEQAVAAYYESPDGLRLTDYVRSPDGLAVQAHKTPAFHHHDQLDHAVVDHLMDEISRTSRVIEYGGSQFEIATTNDDAAANGDLLHISTYRSSISANYGNGYEMATQAARYPNYRHLYIASFGNGGTTPLLKEDRGYVAHTGRYTRDKNGQAVPIQSIQNLYAALDKFGLNITRIMGTDSAGGHYARALAVALEEGQLSHAYFSETSGFVNLSIAGIVRGMVWQENIKNQKVNRAVTPDPEAMDAAKIERFGEHYARYANLPTRRELAAKKVGVIPQLGSMVVAMQALRRGPTNGASPLVNDTNALLARHPDAKISYGVAEHDPLYRGTETAHQAAQALLGELSLQRAAVSIVVVPGMSHGYNTYFPSLYHAIKRYKLEL